jgi:hypothetical protein
MKGAAFAALAVGALPSLGHSGATTIDFETPDVSDFEFTYSYVADGVTFFGNGFGCVPAVAIWQMGPTNQVLATGLPPAAFNPGAAEARILADLSQVPAPVFVSVDLILLGAPNPSCTRAMLTLYDASFAVVGSDSRAAEGGTGTVMHLSAEASALPAWAEIRTGDPGNCDCNGGPSCIDCYTAPYAIDNFTFGTNPPVDVAAPSWGLVKVRYH